MVGAGGFLLHEVEDSEGQLKHLPNELVSLLIFPV